MEQVVEYSSSKGGTYGPVVIINGNKHLFYSLEVSSDCTCLFDLREGEKKLKYNLDEALLENEWNHVEVICPDFNFFPTFIKTGLHPCIEPRK